jgi:hypothetical protein
MMIFEFIIFILIVAVVLFGLIFGIGVVTYKIIDKIKQRTKERKWIKEHVAW